VNQKRSQKGKKLIDPIRVLPKGNFEEAEKWLNAAVARPIATTGRNQQVMKNGHRGGKVPKGQVMNFRIDELTTQGRGGK